LDLEYLVLPQQLPEERVGVQVHRMKKMTMKQNQKIIPMILMKENINVKKNSKDMPPNNNGKRKLE